MLLYKGQRERTIQSMYYVVLVCSPKYKNYKLRSTLKILINRLLKSQHSNVHGSNFKKNLWYFQNNI